LALLQVKNLSIRFNTDEGTVHAVDDLSFSIDKGKTLCIVGESGCGKSVTALSILRLIQSPPGEITCGEIWFAGKNLLKLGERDMRKIRGNDIAMIFQDPMTSLNPVFTCGFQIEEALMLHQNMKKKEAREAAVDMLKQVKIPDPHKRVSEYPHELSGGMRQRAMIAMALSCNPKLLIADEPTTALDVTIQAQILDLLREIKESRDMALMFITHDLGIVAEIADEVLVIYAGRVAERGSAANIYNMPKHPYTIGLLNSVPLMTGKKEKLNVIPGTLPDPTNYPAGCRFYERCDRHSEKCLKQPEEFEVSAGHSAACFHMD
jgi:peptide/nickel transport system ATP-binding protein/oligopeptide transport system ATP-binding protein